MNPVMRVVAAAAAALALGVISPVLSAAALPADTSDFSFASFDGEYFLDVDDAGHSTTRVVETIVARFPDFDQNRGITRALPLTYGDSPLNLTMVSVTDENGSPVYYERNDYDGFAEFALGTDEFVQGETTYVLEYTMKNTIRHFEDSGGDEFYWDVNGDGWAQAFDSVTATVHVSDTLAASLTGKSACYLQYLPANGCAVARDGSDFSVTVAPVSQYNTLTVSIGFDGATVVQPALARDSWIVQVVPPLLLGIGGVLVVLAILVRTLFWRDARGRGIIVAQYEPPANSTLLLDANLVGRKSSALPAQFVDFAVRGIVNVIDTAPGTPVTDDKVRFELELVNTDGASPEELGILVTLFGVTLRPGKRVNPGRLPASIGAALYALPASAAADATIDGYRAAPPPFWSKVLLRIGFWLVPAFVPVWIWAALNNVLEGNVILPAFATVAAVIGVPIILSKPMLLTEKGAAARDYLEGIRLYLTVAEEERMRVLQSPQGAQRINPRDKAAVVKLNERLLPYAVLWGVEDQWAEKLRADYDGAAPTWFSGDSFDSSLLRGFAAASTSSVRPIVSSSSGGWSSSGSSSSSSGSSGGGFSGGGGGGGGGGGR